MLRTGDILVIEDDLPTAEFIVEALCDEGYTARSTHRVDAALACIATRRPQLILCDLHMPGQTTAALAEALQHDGHARIAFIIMTADKAAATNLALQGVDFCLYKPFDLEDLLDCVATHLHSAAAA